MPSWQYSPFTGWRRRYGGRFYRRLHSAYSKGATIRWVHHRKLRKEPISVAQHRIPLDRLGRVFTMRISKTNHAVVTALNRHT